MLTGKKIIPILADNFSETQDTSIVDLALANKGSYLNLGPMVKP